MRRGDFLYFVLVIAATIPLTVSAQGTFSGLGSPDTYVSGMSADGSIIVGVRTGFGPAFRWTDGKTEDIGGVGYQAKISRDGKTIVSNAKDTQGITSAAIWQGRTNWRTLGGVPDGRPSDGVISSAWNLSADGSIIVGLAWVTSGKAHGFRWDALNGMVDLKSLQSDSSRANAISGDGSVIAGWDANPMASDYPYLRGTTWFEGMERLIHPFGWIGQAEAINGNGQIIVGRGHPASYRHAYLFTASDGRIRDLGSIPRGIRPNIKDQEDTSIAYAVSDDGAVVVGTSGFKPPLDPFIWIRGQGKMMKLGNYLASRGITGFERWQLLGANVISPDGKIIAGIGLNPFGLVEGWIVKLR